MHTKFLTATLIRTIVGLAMGFLIFGLALAACIQENASANETQNMLWLVLGHIAFAVLLTIIFQRWAGIKTAGTGAKAGAIISLLFAIAYNWIYPGTTDLFPGGLVATIIDALGVMIIWSITGAAIGWALGRGEA